MHVIAHFRKQDMFGFQLVWNVLADRRSVTIDIGQLRICNGVPRE